MMNNFGFVSQVGPSGNRRNVTTRWRKKGYVKDDDMGFEVQRSVSNDGESETITIISARCAGCNNYFTQDDQPNGSCYYDDLQMCANCCQTRRCWIDERLVCAGCGTKTTYHGWSCGHGEF